MKNTYLTLVLLLGLGGCGGGASDATDATNEEPAGLIPQHQLDAMDKAKGVEDVLNQSEEQRRDPE